MSIRADSRRLRNAINAERQRRMALKVFDLTHSVEAVEAIVGNIAPVVPGFENLMFQDRETAVSDILNNKTSLHCATESVQSVVQKLQLAIAGATLLTVPFAMIKNPIYAVLGLGIGAGSIAAAHLGVKAYEIGKVIPYHEFQKALACLSTNAELAKEFSGFEINLTSHTDVYSQHNKLDVLANKLDILDGQVSDSIKNAVRSVPYSSSGWDVAKFKQGMEDFERVYNSFAGFAGPLRRNAERMLSMVLSATQYDTSDPTGIYELMANYSGWVEETLGNMETLTDICKDALRLVAHKYDMNA